jgi:hypothetical protein
MPKRLAITISGAVSLGSYEAGVLYEIIDAIKQHNEHDETKKRPEEKIEIDVLTGASAGGMTATIAAQKLAFDGKSLEGPYDNCFYRPWVADIGLDSLMDMHGDDDATKSILSSQTVEDISVRYLTQRYQSPIKPEPQRHPAAGNVLQLGLALSNLNGVDYGLPIHSLDRNDAQNEFIYTRYQDQLVKRIDASEPEKDDIEPFWEPIRNACVSCGAFPFAFRAVDVIRHACEYKDPDLVSTILTNQSFAYTDGGTFQNEPLGLAKNLVDEIDQHLDVDNRFYLFVAPNNKGSTANADFNARSADYTKTTVQLIGSIYGQARFHDWIMAEGINTQVIVFNKRAEELHDLLKDAPEEKIELLQKAATFLLEPLYRDGAPPGQPEAETLEAARERLAKQFSNLGRLPDAAQKAWIDSLLTFEVAAQLGERDEMRIYGITANSAELASSELFAFAGFFDRRYRDHDYDVGRTKARDFLRKPGRLGPIRCDLDDKNRQIRPIDPSLDGLKLEQMDRATRVAVRECLRSRVKIILQQMGINWPLIGGLAREVIDWAVVRRELNKILKL